MLTLNAFWIKRAREKERTKTKTKITYGSYVRVKLNIMYLYGEEIDLINSFIQTVPYMVD